MIEFNNFNSNIEFTYEFRKASIKFFDLLVKLFNGKIQDSLYMKPRYCNQNLHVQSSHPNIPEGQWYTVKH